MIKVTEPAKKYLKNVLDEQDIDDLHLRLVVDRPGTPMADCYLNFCEENEMAEGDEALDQGDFKIVVEKDHEKYLQGAEIDYEETETGGQLNIKAPGLKGREPGQDAPLKERVEWFLNSEINPQLASHGGWARLVDLDDEGYAIIEFGGGCHGCGMASQTLSMGIESKLLQAFPEIKGVLDATDHSTGENPYIAAS